MNMLDIFVLVVLFFVAVGIYTVYNLKLLHASTPHIIVPDHTFWTARHQQAMELVNASDLFVSPFAAIRDSTPSSGVRCAYCGSMVPENARKCESCGART